MIHPIRYIDLPTTPYADVWQMQKGIFSRLLSGDETDSLILCEHPPVYTLGRATDVSNVLFSESELGKLGAEKFEIERGGDVTFHGPGQLVGYPLLNLARFKEDLGWYLRALEETIITVLRHYSIEGFRVAGKTGVWVRHNNDEEKICAIGVKVSKWCTMHGFAFNINTDLHFFDHIIPCGIADKNVTSLKELLGRETPLAEVKQLYSQAFCEVFDTAIVASELHSVEN